MKALASLFVSIIQRAEDGLESEANDLAFLFLKKLAAHYNVEDFHVDGFEPEKLVRMDRRLTQIRESEEIEFEEEFGDLYVFAMQMFKDAIMLDVIENSADPKVLAAAELWSDIMFNIDETEHKIRAVEIMCDVAKFRTTGLRFDHGQGVLNQSLEKLLIIVGE